MKLLIFIIILLALYYIATQIKVVHINTLPESQKNELVNKNKIRDMLKTSYIKSSDDVKDTVVREKFSKYIDPIKYFVNDDTKNSQDVLDKIKFNFVEKDFIFNVPNLPVTRKNVDSTKYIKFIHNEINLWKSLDPEIYIRDISPIDMLQTSQEFLIRSNVEISYRENHIYLQTVFYGKIYERDDILTGKNRYNLRLVSVRKIDNKSYHSKNFNDNPFLTMEQQMAYVEKINQMHIDE